MKDRRSGYLYPGDHEDKQTARLVLYRHAKAAPIQGYAVTLAGTEPASEVRLMRDYLQWPAHRAWFVDKNTSPIVIRALRQVTELWPGTNTARINLKNLVPRLGALGFANLDFMGAPLTDDNIQCLEEVVPLLLSGAVLGLTWIRGREVFGMHHSAERLWKLGKGHKGNERRWAGVLQAIDNISEGSLVLLDRWEYVSNRSPMSVAIFRKE